MKRIKKSFFLTIIFSILISIFMVSGVSASYKPPFEITSKAAYLVNLDTGTVIFEKNADEKIYPASLVKIMTTILAIEMIPDLENTIIKASPYIFDELYLTGASHADIRPNEEVRAIDVLYGVMLQSACEGASMIADYLGQGNITEFVELMNKKAKELGATNTVFKNAHGLHDPEQVTTAKDMYLIAKYAMENPIFEKICTTNSYQMPATNKHATPYYVLHTNSMMSKERSGDYYYPHIRGIKTGSLPEVGRNLASMATFEGYNYMLVTLNSPTVNEAGETLPIGTYTDAKQLYNWAFSFFEQQTVMNEGDVVAETNVKLCADQDYITLVANDNVYALLPRGVDRSTIQQVKTFEKDLIAPIPKGTKLGKVELRLNDEIISTVDLITYENIGRNNILYMLDVTKRFFSQGIIQVLIVIVVLLVFTFIALSARYKKIKRQRAAKWRMQHRQGF